MKRLVLLGLMLGSLGLAACAANVGDTGPEPAAQGPTQLEVQAPKPTLDGDGTPGDPGQSGGSNDIHPRPLAEGADPSGPSPYPWNGNYEEDPNGGPSPYPWKHATTAGGPGAGTGTDGQDSTATPSPNGK